MKKIQRAFFEKTQFSVVHLIKQGTEQEVKLLKEVPLILMESNCCQSFWLLHSGFKKKNAVSFEKCLLSEIRSGKI